MEIVGTWANLFLVGKLENLSCLYVYERFQTPVTHKVVGVWIKLGSGMHHGVNINEEIMVCTLIIVFQNFHASDKRASGYSHRFIIA